MTAQFQNFCIPGCLLTLLNIIYSTDIKIKKKNLIDPPRCKIMSLICYHNSFTTPHPHTSSWPTVSTFRSCCPPSLSTRFCPGPSSYRPAPTRSRPTISALPSSGTHQSSSPMVITYFLKKLNQKFMVHKIWLGYSCTKSFSLLPTLLFWTD